MLTLQDMSNADISDYYAAKVYTQRLALVSCTLLIYDFFVTLPREVRYVWGSRLSFGRCAFHLNRFCGPLLLSLYVPSRSRLPPVFECCGRLKHSGKFSNVHVSPEQRDLRQNRNIRSVFINHHQDERKIALATIGVLIVRTWAVYGVSISQTHHRFNLPAPEVIPGCTFKTGKELKISYIAPFLFQTSIMVMTAYKAWSFSREHRSTLLMTKMLHELSKNLLVGYFDIDNANSTNFMLVLTYTFVKSLFTTISSIMCSRIILYGFSLSQRTNITTTFEDAMEITFSRSRRPHHEWSVEVDEIRESLDREESGYSLPIVVKVPSLDFIYWFDPLERLSKATSYRPKFMVNARFWPVQSDLRESGIKGILKRNHLLGKARRAIDGAAAKMPSETKSR
ncbi:hypothetical protein BDV93DRAFT_508235 [Ceratobasidium sp. AG-I]|nr:hypothetical protein BDV93DRAFT_508235 [Ceratobasidium sp. AG-I]